MKAKSLIIGCELTGKCFLNQIFATNNAVFAMAKSNA